MKMRTLKKRRAAGSRLYRMIRAWAIAEHKRLDEIAARKMKERESWLPPVPFAMNRTRPEGVMHIPVC